MNEPVFETKWIRISPAALKGGKTERWWVEAVRGGAVLGMVRWLSAWRRYCFFPRAECAYDAECLRDLATFCETRTNEQKAKWKT